MNDENVMKSNYKEVFKLEFPKRYKIDMDKVNSIKDIEQKVNVILQIFTQLNLIIEEHIMTDELRVFCKEM